MPCAPLLVGWLGHRDAGLAELGGQRVDVRHLELELDARCTDLRCGALLDADVEAAAATEAQVAVASVSTSTPSRST